MTNHTNIKSPYQPTSDPLIRRRAWRGLIIYWIIAVVLTAFTSWLRVAQVTKNPRLNDTAIILVPVIAATIARLVLREGFGDVSFRIGGRRGVKALGLAWLLAFTMPFIAYGLGWVTGLVPFAPLDQLAAAVQKNGISTEFIKNLVLSATLFTFIFTIIFAGEEIGWRGFMLTRMIDSGIPKPIFVSGIIWVLFHFPIIIFGAYSAAGAGTPLWFTLIMFSISALALNYILSWLRLQSGSVWSACLLHGGWNAMTQGALDGFSNGPNRAFWVAESGIFTVAVLILSVLLVRKYYAQQWDA